MEESAASSAPGRVITRVVASSRGVDAVRTGRRPAGRGRTSEAAFDGMPARASGGETGEDGTAVGTRASSSGRGGGACGGGACGDGDGGGVGGKR